MESKTNYIAINASAGSGKTYTLVQRILILCLAYPNKHDAIRHILALTFTNKAAKEMKERILKWLKNFTKPNYAQNNELIAIQAELQKRGINATLEDLHERAQKVLVTTPASEHEGLLNAHSLREASVEANRPPISVELLRFDALRDGSAKPWYEGGACNSYLPTSAASLTTRSSALIISSQSKSSSTEI